MNDLEQTAIERMKAVPDMSQRLFEKPLGSPTPEGNARGENPMRYIASISYGKDSLAQLEIASLRRLYNEFPEYWEMMMDWDADTEKRFKVDHTLADYDRRFRMEAEGLLSSDDKNFRWSMLDGPLQMRLF